MKKLLTTILFAMAVFVNATAQKALYIPDEWKHPWPSDSLLYKENDPDNKYTWSKTRSKESENFICYWDKYYKTEPTKVTGYYNVNIDDLLKKAEAFYALNVGKLAFCDEAKSKVSKYKMMILINHTETWTCYGGGYDFTIGALWLNPATCKPVGHSVAHEVGHSFQYMCYSDNGGHSGFHDAIGSGSTFWEQTAQWQANQSYPELKFDQSWSLFKFTHNYAMTHEWHRYQSYWWHYYLTEKYGIDFIGRLWRHPMSKAADANEVFMNMMGYDVKQLYKEYFDYAMKMATLDLDVVSKTDASKYIGTYAYNYVPLAPNKHQVAYSSCPQATGFNVIPLNVPAAGTKISTHFTSLKNTSYLAEGDPRIYFDGEKYLTHPSKKVYNNTTNYNTKRGFRLGYVALMNDGSRQYFSQDSVYCAGGTGALSCDVGFTVPEGVDRIFMVVSPAPSAYYQHKWDKDGTDKEKEDNIGNDDQWPYTVEFDGTNIVGAPNILPVIEDGMPISDASITYDVYFPKSTEYANISINVTGDDASVLATAFQMPATDVGGKMAAWSSAGPKDGKIMFYAVNANGQISNTGSSANGYGHWFNSAGNRSDWNSGYVFSEFDSNNMSFTLGQYPGKVSNGQNYTIRQALKYKRGTETATVTFIFNIHVTSSRGVGYEISDYKQSETITTLDNLPSPNATPSAYYSLSGSKLDAPHKGINIMKMSDGTVRKLYVK